MIPAHIDDLHTLRHVGQRRFRLPRRQRREQHIQRRQPIGIPFLNDKLRQLRRYPRKSLDKLLSRRRFPGRVNDIEFRMSRAQASNSPPPYPLTPAIPTRMDMPQR